MSERDGRESERGRERERVREGGRERGLKTGKEKRFERILTKEILIKRRNIKVKKRKSEKYIYEFRKKDQKKTVKKIKEHPKEYISYLLIIPDKV